MTDDALVHSLELGITTGTSQIACVINFVADLEAGYGVPHRLNDAGGIPTEQFGLLFYLVFRRPNLRVDRIHRDGFYPDQNVMV